MQHVTWFEELTGFREESPEQVREKMLVERDKLRSLVNGRTYYCGTLETPSLAELRARVRECDLPTGAISLREVVADVQSLHLDQANAGALFQVASQFNLLEMASPERTPEDGVGIYQFDHTQGPACAIAAGAGTIFRNYFVRIDDQTGQSAERQIDCLADLGAALGNEGARLWTMRNGYALASADGLDEITAILDEASNNERDELRQLLRIGVQWNTEVTFSQSGREASGDDLGSHTVSQAYCAALPIGYSRHSPDAWEPFARLVLEATYEATMSSAILNYVHNGNNTLYLTLVGGGVFGNRIDWIIDAIRRAIELHRAIGLDVAIVSYARSKPAVRQLIAELDS